MKNVKWKITSRGLICDQTNPSTNNNITGMTRNILTYILLKLLIPNENILCESYYVVNQSKMLASPYPYMAVRQNHNAIIMLWIYSDPLIADIFLIEI